MKVDKKSPTVFPISIERALRYWLPGVKHADRGRDWRHFLSYCHELNDQAIKFFGGPAKAGYDVTTKDKLLNREQFAAIGPAFLEWRQNLIRRKRSAAGRLGGRPKNASKSTGKNSFDEVK